MTDRAVRCLSIHARYRCRDSGACCTAGWPIPVEAERLRPLEHALAMGGLALARPNASGAFRWPPHAPNDTPAVLAVEANACVFYRRAGTQRCEIHRQLGHDALPLACRQFPRVSVIDPRGASVTLSHYCPTAASLLDIDTPLSIVDNAPAFPADGEYVGLDVRDDLPPSLRPDMLMDWEAWWAWEELAVDQFARAGHPDRALAAIGAIVERVRSWRPSDGPLMDRIRESFARSSQVEFGAVRPLDHAARLQEILEAIPADVRPSPAELAPRTSRPSPSTVRRFLAAHTFASWTSQLGEGLRSWHRSIEAAFALLELGLGVRRADLLLRHLSDPHALAQAWSRAERE